MKKFLVCFFVPGAMCVSGCAVTPPLSEAQGSIPVHDIVERVKCELADTFDRKTQERDFLWLRDWTAKADLTLIANNQGGITPAVTYIDLLRTVSSVSQQFSFGASGSFSAQAVRTEAVSFSLSLKELKAWREGLLRDTARGLPDPCAPAAQLDLAGDLGLREWVDSALSPVALRDLEAGDHPAPGTAKASPAGGKKAVSFFGAKTQREIADAAASEAAASAKAAGTSADAAEKSYRQAARAIDNSPYRAVENELFLTKSQEFADAAHQQAKAAKADEKKADLIAKEARAVADSIGVDDESDAAKAAAGKAKADSEKADELARDAAGQAKAAAQNAKLVAGRVPDAPIDSLSHSVQFVVSAGGSIAPGWTLVQFRGPTGTLAGISGTRTHTLNLALGPRGDNGARYSQEAVRALTNMTLQQIKLNQ